MTALAVEDTSARSVAEAARYLEEERGVRDVILIGASAGTGGVLGAVEEYQGIVDGLILLSGTGEISGLGAYPKLFVASEGEGLAEKVRSMAEEAPESRNEALILPGDAHAQAIFETDQGERLMRATIEQLEDDGWRPHASGRAERRRGPARKLCRRGLPPVPRYLMGA